MCDYGIKKTVEKKSYEEVLMTMVDFQQQSPQRLVDKYKHTSNRNDL